MKVLFCISEAVPLAKTGGLADVGGALPAALRALGCEVRVVLPRYRGIEVAGWWRAGSVRVPLGERTVEAVIWDGAMPDTGVPVWLVDQPQLFDRPGLYGDGGSDYPDNLARFACLCRAALDWLPRQQWRPDLVHCHDWQTALIPPLVASGQAPPLPTLLTIHNLAYQGIFPADQFPLTGLPPRMFSVRGLEFWGKVNVLKGGLIYADMLSTVSPTYAREIQTPEFGAGLDGVLRERGADLVGILNGVDYRIWDPAHDPHLPAPYTREDLSGKRVCKEYLQREVGLDVRPDAPLVGMVGRLVEQKGIDLVVAAAPEILARGAQLVVLGTGEPRYEQMLQDLARRESGRVAVRIGFDDALAHRIEAGADLFVMPSRYEPSGLNQLYSLRYGTVPVVRRTGGLADSIVDATPDALEAGTATGFVFDAYSPEALATAVARALEVYRTPALWKRLQRAGMSADFSWQAAARRYLDLYERTLAAARRRR
ncbi:MAG: glycogen synthase GlgA [Armatimonadota bacterium]|nr:glycogen synthase GlgA [Armatimonadota bacterium]MDR7403661.1 glycogen synthase GlgA [Armatimonadota bacterium]MDR7437270.1 glycogen synthase GlgA [Armatimonadota bacterium]